MKQYRTEMLEEHSQRINNYFHTNWNCESTVAVSDMMLISDDISGRCCRPHVLIHGGSILDLSWICGARLMPAYFL